jgi:hypothetical protein
MNCIECGDELKVESMELLTYKGGTYWLCERCAEVHLKDIELKRAELKLGEMQW